MISAVVVVKNQLKNALEVFGSLARQTMKLDHVVAVVEGDDFEPVARIASSFGFETVRASHPFKGFSAGANRDLGIKHVERLYGRSHFVFLDGDCVSSTDLVKHHSGFFGRCTVTCGLRVDRTSLRADGSYGLFPDRRTSNFKNSATLVSGKDLEIKSVEPILANSACWSCNMGISADAVDLLRKINNLLPEADNRVFSQVFDGLYGGEDAFVGLSVVRASGRVVMLDPSRSHIEHIQHVVASGSRTNFPKMRLLDREFLSQLRNTEHGLQYLFEPVDAERASSRVQQPIRF